MTQYETDNVYSNILTWDNSPLKYDFGNMWKGFHKVKANIDHTANKRAEDLRKGWVAYSGTNTSLNELLYSKETSNNTEYKEYFLSKAPCPFASNTSCMVK